MIQGSRFRAVIVGGSIAATLDILFALTFAAFNGVGPLRLLQTVASGLLGEAAYTGGVPGAILGLCAHFGLSYLWAVLFVTVASRYTALVRKPVPTGALFGIVVFFAMRLVVLPLSAFPHPVTFKPLSAGLDLLSHMFFFGVPIAVTAAIAIRHKDPQ
jgi:uncharacterized membrane protein YagU involved in acid resistance